MIEVERDEEHRYFLSIPGVGSKVQAIGVTQAIIASNLIDDTYFTDRARARGRLAHFFAERLATNTLGAPIDRSILQPMIGFRKFLEHYGPIVHNAEMMMGNIARLLAGTADLDLSMMNMRATVEIKLSTPTAWHGLQLAPYAYLQDGPKWMERARFGLYLNDRGGFRLKEYDDLTDLDTFFQAHELLHWRIKHGTYERPYGRSDRRNDTGDPLLSYDGEGDGGNGFDPDQYSG